MKKQSILSTLLIVAFVSHSAAQEAPLRCSFNETLIECDVRADVADVTNAALNRGNCASPIPTEEQKQKAKNYIDSLSESDKAAMAVSPLGFILTMQQQGKADVVSAIILSNNDPIGKRKFGDQFKIFNTCENLIEYTITVNGEEWTWETE